MDLQCTLSVKHPTTFAGVPGELCRHGVRQTDAQTQRTGPSQGTG